MSRSSPLILYVDDERGNRVVFEQTFSGRFPSIRATSSAAEALEVLRGEPVAVVVADQRMPEMSGNELLSHVREQYPQTIRIILTAYSDLEPILRAVNEGLVARYIVKPWSRDELEQILAWALEAHRLGQDGSMLQLRLLQIERLATIGSIGTAVMHDIRQPVASFSYNAMRLTQLSRSAEALTRLVRAHDRELEETDFDNLVNLAEELPSVCKELEEGCQTIRELSESVMRMARPATKAITTTPDAASIVRSALAVCREPISRARAHARYEGPATLPILEIGPTELIQTLINLVMNAAQALAEQTDPPGRITINAVESDHGVRFSVTDSGPGMSKEALRKVGTPFFSTRPDGAGLGLSQCRRIVEQHEGVFQIESRRGSGTTVTFTIPRHPG